MNCTVSTLSLLRRSSVRREEIESGNEEGGEGKRGRESEEGEMWRIGVRRQKEGGKVRREDVEEWGEEEGEGGRESEEGRWG